MEKKISVIVITYKRLEVLKGTINSLLLEQNDFEELILVDNCSQDGTLEYGQQLEIKQKKVKFYSLPENGGVAAGRNFAVQQALGDILVFIDDDAVFNSQGYLPEIEKKFEQNENLGILAFRIINYYSGKMQAKEFPFTNKKLDQEKERKTSTYIGAGHAIRKEVFEKCGDYPEDFFYGGEELDLSFRAIDHGYEIIYYPTVEVLHKQVPTGRVEESQKWIMTYCNRLVTAYKYLPNPYRNVSAFVWYIKIALKTKSFRVPNEALKFFKTRKKNLDVTERIGKSALKYMEKNYGRLWY